MQTYNVHCTFNPHLRLRYTFYTYTMEEAMKILTIEMNRGPSSIFEQNRKDILDCHLWLPCNIWLCSPARDNKDNFCHRPTGQQSFASVDPLTLGAQRRRWCCRSANCSYYYYYAYGPMNNVHMLTYHCTRLISINTMQLCNAINTLHLITTAATAANVC